MPLIEKASSGGGKERLYKQSLGYHDKLGFEAFFFLFFFFFFLFCYTVLWSAWAQSLALLNYSFPSTTFATGYCYCFGGGNTAAAKPEISSPSSDKFPEPLHTAAGLRSCRRALCFLRSIHINAHAHCSLEHPGNFVAQISDDGAAG